MTILFNLYTAAIPKTVRFPSKLYRYLTHKESVPSEIHVNFDKKWDLALFRSVF